MCTHRAFESPSIVRISWFCPPHFTLEDQPSIFEPLKPFWPCCNDLDVCLSSHYPILKFLSSAGFSMPLEKCYTY